MSDSASVGEFVEAIHVVTQNNQKDPGKAFGYHDPTYSFPRSGIFFSTKENTNGQAVFQFSLKIDLRLTGSHPAQDSNDRIKASVFVQGSEFSRIKVDLDRDSVALKANSIGLQYVFVGRFDKRSYLESEYSRQIVLTGTLQKFVLGRKVSEEYLEFWYGVGC